MVKGMLLGKLHKKIQIKSMLMTHPPYRDDIKVMLRGMNLLLKPIFCSDQIIALLLITLTNIESLFSRESLLSRSKSRNSDITRHRNTL
jgi:hypothetical protein